MQPTDTDECEHKKADVENINVLRVKFQSGLKCYLMKGESSLMASFANESSYDESEPKALLNFTCRMISKYLAHGGNWDEVARMAERSGFGYKTIVSEIKHVAETNYELVGAKR